MRDRVVGSDQERPNRSHLGTLDMLGHSAKPLGIHHLQIVTEKQQPRAVRLVDGKIIDRRITKRPFVVYYPALNSVAGNRFLPQPFFIADEHDFVIGIGRATDAGEATFEQLAAIV